MFLLALPLSIGISLASGFPAASGLITAVIGGILVAPFAGSPMTIKGPAAGMIVIMLGAVEELGKGNIEQGIRLALAGVAVTGVIQIAMGMFKLGKIGRVFPEAAMKGMLAAIGVIIIAKQGHLMMGHAPWGKTPVAQLMEFPKAVTEANPYIAAIGLLSIAVAFVWPKLVLTRALSKLKRIPTAIVVVTFSIASAFLFHMQTEHAYQFLGGTYSVGPGALVSIPKSLSAAILTPDFSAFAMPSWWKWLFLIAAVSSLESMLTVKAIYGLDPRKRPADQNKDLIALGVGNVTAGMLGGLPMIAEVVRSSANLGAGADSRWSNFFHGLFLAVFVGLLSPVIQMIPVAALSGLLVFTGFRLIGFERWREIYDAGREQFFVFILTMVVTVTTDLLTGIAVGMLCELFLNVLLAGSVRGMLKAQVRVREEYTCENSGKVKLTAVEVLSALTFVNLLPAVERIQKILASEVIIDMSRVPYIDHTSMHALHDLGEQMQRSGRVLRLEGLEGFRSYSNHPLSARRNRITILPQLLNHEPNEY